MNKRQRGRGRKPSSHNSNNPNRSLDSNGPDVKIRGSASTIFDKYTTLARDATSSGHRVKAENYLQHAEHYLRLVMEQQAKAAAHAEKQAAQQQARQSNTENPNTEQKDDDGQGRNNDRGRRYPARRRQPNQNEAQDQNASDERAKNPQENDKAVEAETPETSVTEATAPEADAKPKKTRRKKPVEAATETPPEESVITAAE